MNNWIMVGAVYAAAINITAFTMMGFDKKRAVRHGRRVPEKRLFAAAALGGAFGGYIGMKIWRHKTKHRSFNVGFPALLIVQIVILVWLIQR
jgi:uncharacterized membrane protein YsdA (DUF1294 family)